jgi:hypothetical protein
MAGFGFMFMDCPRGGGFARPCLPSGEARALVCYPMLQLMLWPSLFAFTTALMTAARLAQLGDRDGSA